jgi:hypothetical protein
MSQKGLLDMLASSTLVATAEEASQLQDVRNFDVDFKVQFEIMASSTVETDPRDAAIRRCCDIVATLFKVIKSGWTDHISIISENYNPLLVASSLSALLHN